MKVLFVCSQNRLRSPTAERVFCGWPGIDARSAGTDRDATVPVSEDLVAWADLIFVMEKRHRNVLWKRFGSRLAAKRLVTLNVPDEYDYMDAGLVRLLEEAAGPYLRRARGTS
jgi:predicted protein tyrosine phosphatase